MTLFPGELLENRYQIIAPIGRGGFGAVYLAQDDSLQLYVAIKENLETTHSSQQQFIQEAVLLARLRHPNLPRVTHHFIIPGRGQYLVMDYVHGQSLIALLEEYGGPLAEAEVLPWVRQVCDALHYLHTYNPPIIHRDVKPANIIITPADQAMLVDFGISKLYQASHRTHSGARAYSEGYSPPEQYGSGSGTTARSDVYALGATLYVLLTATLPPESPEIAAGNEQLIPPRRLNPRISPVTERAILAAMNVNASRRLDGAAALRDALDGRFPAQPAQVAPPVVRPAAAAPARTATRSGGSGCVRLLVLLALVAAGAFAANRWLGLPVPPLSSVIPAGMMDSIQSLVPSLAATPAAPPLPTTPAPVVIPPLPTEEDVEIRVPAPRERDPAAGAPLLFVNARVRVATDGNDLNFRDAPNGRVLGDFPNGAELTVLEGPVEAGGRVWWRVRGAAGEGWSAAEFMTLIE
jgi:hypothetical protein